MNDQNLITDMVHNQNVNDVFTTYQIKNNHQRTGYRSDIVDPADTYEYVIITNEALKNSQGEYTFQDLVQSKIDKGLNAIIVTVEEIEACPEYHWNGVYGDGNPIYDDAQCHIRNFIKDAYENWETQYVLLGGDADSENLGGESENTIIPVRLLNDSVNLTDEIPSDLYYGCLDGTFDANGNGIYGEYNSITDEDVDYADLLAEVYIGRAPVDSESEVSHFVRKTLVYEQTDDDLYLRQVLLVGEHIGFGGIADWGGNYKNEIRDGSSAWGHTTSGIPDYYDVDTIYDMDWEMNGWDEPWYGNDGWPKSVLLEKLNSGTHILNHVGHGNNFHIMKLDDPVCMRYGVINEECHDIRDNLTNELYFFGYSQACDSGAFDNVYDIPGVDEDPASLPYDSIIEHLLTEEHGAFAFIGNTRLGFGIEWSTNGPSQHFDREFFDALYSENKRNLGIAQQDSKEDTLGMVIENYPVSQLMRYCYYDITLFGDPEISLKIPPLRDHDVCVSTITAPAYFNPEDGSVIVNATIWNIGVNDEELLQVNFYIDEELIDSTSITELESFEKKNASFSWDGTSDGIHEIIIEVEPVAGEDHVEDNRKTKHIHVMSSDAVLVCALDSLVTDFAPYLYDILNENSPIYGDIPLYIDYTTLNKDDITYSDLVNSSANVLLIHLCLYTLMPGCHWVFTFDEVNAITQYVEEGHQLIIVYQCSEYTNELLRPLVGLTDFTFIRDYVTGVQPITIFDEGHPLFSHLNNPFDLPCATKCPVSGKWTEDNIQPDACFVAQDEKLHPYHPFGPFGSIVLNTQNNMFISWILEAFDQHDNQQFFYNALTFAHNQSHFYTFLKSPDIGIVNMPQHMYSYSCGGVRPYSWEWDFGDGNISGEQNPFHTFTQVGTYTVAMTSRDALGNSYSDTCTIEIKEVHADTHGTYEGFATEPVHFQGSALYNSSIATWHWNFGNGNESWAQNPSYTYMSKGNFTVTLTVTDVEGHSDTNTTTIVVVDPLIVEVEGPEGCYYGIESHGWRVYYCIIGEEYFFDGTTQGGFPPYLWQWSINANWGVKQEDMTFIFTTVESHGIVLHVQDDHYNFRDSEPIVVKSRRKLIVNAQGPTGGYPNQELQFLGAASGGHWPYYTWHWNFGDGQSSSDQHPYHAYPQEGEYLVTLNVTDNEGISASDTLTVFIDGTQPVLTLRSPQSGGVYLWDHLLFQRLFSKTPLIFGPLTISVDANDDVSGIGYVEFFIDGTLVATDDTAPYEWLWEIQRPRIPFPHLIRITAYDNVGNRLSEELTVRKFW